MHYIYVATDYGANGTNVVQYKLSGMILLHCALSLVAQCIVIGPVCGCVCNGRVGGVCYHDNSKLRASIFTKLSL